MRSFIRPFGTFAAAAALSLMLASCAQSPAAPEAPETPEEPKAAEAALPQRAARVAQTDALNVCQTRTVTGPTSDCGTYQREELCQPIQVSATGGVLSTQLDVAKRWQCVPELVGKTDTDPGHWEINPKLLRNYGYGGRYGFPGPTFRLTRASAKQPVGDRFKMLFSNSLGPTTVAEQMKCDTSAPFQGDAGNHPNCFHGNEVTNFHFHGFHVSPQPLQDYVLLKLYPRNTPGIRNYDPGLTNEQLRHFEEIGGSYRYDVNPLPYNQPEGTHWYHAHHHGATAMQVINGMAGTFIVEGPFDYWLTDYYLRRGLPKPKDRLMVIQQINDIRQSTTPLVNGQGNPTVTVAPGEVQRWRFVSATTQASAQLDVFFGEKLQVCQIQMDGIQFSPKNYVRQPLLTFDRPSGGFCGFGAKFELSPGNRADFLVKMPVDTPPQQEFQMMHKVIGSLGDEMQDRLEDRIGAMAQVMETAGLAMDMGMEKDMIPLMTIRTADAVGVPMPLPESLPRLPEYLTPPTPGPGKEIHYQMYRTTGGMGRPAPIFKINDMQVRECVPKETTVTRGTDELWVVYNEWTDSENGTLGPALVAKELPDGTKMNRGIAHPFHIHVNPFYVYRNGNDFYTEGCTQAEACGIWQDTIALPLAEDNDPNKIQASSVALHMEFEDYTGGYVQHCHILGHEDRGMMTLVQTRCPGSNEYGTPALNGTADNCAAPRQSLPVCPD